MVTKQQLNNAEAERSLTNKKKLTPRDFAFTAAGILLSGILQALSVQCFIVPNAFAPGGITGVASILEYIFKFNVGYFLLAMNVPFIILGAIFVSPRFGIVSGLSIVLSSLLTVLIEKSGFPPLFFGADAGERTIAAIAGGVLGGVGSAIMLKLGGSRGGTDILAAIIQRRYSATNIAWFIFVLDGIVVLASVFVYPNPIVPIMLALIEIYVESKVTEVILQGFQSALKFEIVTKDPEGLSRDIMENLARGVTMLPAKGMYTGSDSALLICVVRKRQMTQFREILKRHEGTFAYVSGANEVMGEGFGSAHKL